MYTSGAVVLFILAETLCHPLENSDSKGSPDEVQLHRVPRDLETPSIVAEESLIDFAKIRTRRSSEEDCERLALCRLHAQSAHSLIGSFQLYFVSKENARLWDHRTRSAEECSRRYPACGAPRAPPAPRTRRLRADYYDDY